MLGAGFGLHWKSLNVDMTVSGLLNGVFGTRAWMDGLGMAEDVVRGRRPRRDKDVFAPDVRPLTAFCSRVSNRLC